MYHKNPSTMRQLACGASAKSLDENLRIADSAYLESLQQFVETVISIFGDKNLRSPNEPKLYKRISWLGLVDCMHCKWENCPKAWDGIYKGRYKKSTVILEAVACADVWFLHDFFGIPGSNNDINVLDRSTLFQDYIDGTSFCIKFTVKGDEYNSTFLLAYGIYLEWSEFPKPIKIHIGNKKRDCS